MMAMTPGFLTALLLAAAKGLARIQTALANRRAAKELLNWDDAALKDIGLTRSDVRGSLAEPLLEDPTVHLSLIAAGRTPTRRQNGATRDTTAGLKPVAPVAGGRARLGTLPSAEPVLCT
jgi:uncharacterized protein YjiS (DUF1127 family)